MGGLEGACEVGLAGAEVVESIIFGGGGGSLCGYDGMGVATSEAGAGAWGCGGYVGG